LEQRSPEWFEARLGMVSASRVYVVVAKGRNGQPSISRQKYQDELVEERLTGQLMKSSYTNEHIEWGREKEAVAREQYEQSRKVKVGETGFVLHPKISWSGASPDGLVGRTGLVEIKCPSTRVHLECCEKGNVPARYIYQMQWQLACTKRDWCDFVSYDPRAPKDLRLLIVRVPTDPAMIRWLEYEVKLFIREIEQRISEKQRNTPIKRGDRIGRTIANPSEGRRSNISEHPLLESLGRSGAKTSNRRSNSIRSAPKIRATHEQLNGQSRSAETSYPISSNIRHDNSIERDDGFSGSSNTPLFDSLGNSDQPQLHILFLQKYWWAILVLFLTILFWR
jgi:putative phage-type endonuclease